MIKKLPMLKYKLADEVIFRSYNDQNEYKGIIIEVKSKTYRIKPEGKYLLKYGAYSYVMRDEFELRFAFQAIEDGAITRL